MARHTGCLFFMGACSSKGVGGGSGSASGNAAARSAATAAARRERMLNRLRQRGSGGGPGSVGDTLVACRIARSGQWHFHSDLQ